MKSLEITHCKEKEIGQIFDWWKGFCPRCYNSDTGRFLSEDPIGFKSGDSNFYRYVENNPLTFIDPYGEVNSRCITKVYNWYFQSRSIIEKQFIEMKKEVTCEAANDEWNKKFTAVNKELNRKSAN